MKIDLHAHTFYSDGSFSPAEVVNLALERDVKYLAITDHNIISGIKEAVKTAEGKPINLIAGIEIDSAVKCSKDPCHIVGLYLDINTPSLKKLLEEITEKKRIKSAKRLELVNKYFNSNITHEELQEKTKGTPGTPHMAMVLLDKNLVKDIGEGIKLFTKRGTLHFESPEKPLMAEEAIKIIHEAGGLAVLAHLPDYKKENKFVSETEQENLVKELVSYGLDGMEVYLADISEKDKKFCEKIAKKYKLKVSCGSDFHNEKFIPQNKLGIIDINPEKITILRKD